MSKKTLTTSELKLKKVAALAKQYTDLKVDASSINLYVKATPNTGYLKTYILSTAKTLAGVAAGNTIGEIDIPKDFLVKSGSVVDAVHGTGADAEKWFVGEVEVAAGGKYVDLVLNSQAADATAQHVVIAVTDLVDVYTGGNGVAVSAGNVISLELTAAGGLQFDGSTDGSKTLEIKIYSTKANGLSVDSNGLQLALATSTTPGAMSAADKVNLDQALLTNAEMASWFGYDITGTPAEGSEAAAVKAMIEAISSDSITDEA